MDTKLPRKMCQYSAVSALTFPAAVELFPTIDLLMLVRRQRPLLGAQRSLVCHTSSLLTFTRPGRRNVLRSIWAI